jgi:hypothetical protein
VARAGPGPAPTRWTDAYLDPDADRLRDAVDRLGPLRLGEER